MISKRLLLIDHFLILKGKNPVKACKQLLGMIWRRRNCEREREREEERGRERKKKKLEREREEERGLECVWEIEKERRIEGVRQTDR